MTAPAAVDQQQRADRMRDTARIVALADIYVATNHISDLLEQRLEAIQRALDAGATEDAIAQALGGADHRPPPGGAHGPQ